ncbi:unnamed protein product [Candidula unifasciata]|uniref:G-protein coupled receptors family 1 profile domain-containing protein n=1 Tax=Candidula unifasciata TaxID=100452 RepID=A0A8S3YRW4_9EUPU|nr:unnamed protein product [Candidula unifasciata]
MTSVNFSEVFDENFLSTYNASLFFSISRYDDLNSFLKTKECENETQHVLANGTITKVFYTCPLLVAVGLLSNILAYLVFTRTRLRRVPSVPYLSAMAVVDSGALVTEFVINGIVLHGIYIITWPGVCQYTTYLNFVFIFLCIWYPVAMCVEKFIGVYFPLRKAALCTTFRAKVVVICMMVLTGTCYYYVIYMVGSMVLSKQLYCFVFDVFRTDFSILMKIDGVVVVILPAIVLIILMLLICGRGCEYYRISTAVEVTNRNGPSRQSSLRAPVRVTNVIFPVVLIVLVLKLPIGLMRTYVTITGTPSTLWGIQSILMYISRFEWVIKLYIYLVFSPSFRRSTKSLLCDIRIRLKHKCRHDSFDDDEEMAGRGRINIPERADRENNPRACLMVSDV